MSMLQVGLLVHGLEALGFQKDRRALLSRSTAVLDGMSLSHEWYLEVDVYHETLNPKP